MGDAFEDVEVGDAYEEVDVDVDVDERAVKDEVFIPSPPLQPSPSSRLQPSSCDEGQSRNSNTPCAQLSALAASELGLGTCTALCENNERGEKITLLPNQK